MLCFLLQTQNRIGFLVDLANVEILDWLGLMKLFLIQPHQNLIELAQIDQDKGDTILFGKWSGTEIKLDGADYLIMKESDIMGIIG